jgi:hypothetical protein
MQAAIFAADKNGNPLGSTLLKIEGSLSKDKDQKLKIAIYDEASGRTGSSSVKKDGKSFVLDRHPLAYR